MKIVAFIDGCGDYIDVTQKTKKLIRGWVINGHWDIVIDLVARTISHDCAGILEVLKHYNDIVIVPVVRGGDDYNEVIETARRQLEKQKPTKAEK
jgi:hypothetical protein